VCSSVLDVLFTSFWKIYESSFPLSERRALNEQIRIFSNPNYFLEIWAKNGNVVGFIAWWNCENLRFVEHYAVNSDCRSAGYGSRFLKEWLAENEIPVLLEIEPIIDEITQRRQDFYKRLGFKNNDIIHYHPPYHKETQAVKLLLMSFPEPISKENYDKFYLKQCEEIMPKIH
jgi:N-acetylglutamate synthase-like GNAT family acetyltransferase